MADEFKTIAVCRTDFGTKFGLPRQAGLADGLTGRIVFEKEYRVDEALRGIEGFSHLWLLWKFSESERDGWSPTVRPPRLGGNERMGVFATRSPFRPNPIGMSCVKLMGIEKTENEGTCLIVSGIDLMDGTPIYDIKPYLPYTDARLDAVAGFSAPLEDYALEVVFPAELSSKIPPEKLSGLTEALSQDPRPGYSRDPERIYGFEFAGFEVKFSVLENTLTVTDVFPSEH